MCSATGCEKQSRTGGMCYPHYQKDRREARKAAGTLFDGETKQCPRCPHEYRTFRVVCTDCWDTMSAEERRIWI